MHGIDRDSDGAREQAGESDPINHSYPGGHGRAAADLDVACICSTEREKP